LVGVVSLFIAAKYHDQMTRPKVKDYADLCAKAYT